jgi:hypothetical protein
MEAIYSSETSANYHPYYREYSAVHCHLYEILTSNVRIPDIFTNETELLIMLPKKELRF